MTHGRIKRPGRPETPLRNKGTSATIENRTIYGALLIGLLWLYLQVPKTFDLVVNSLSDAFLGVSIFVALTLAAFHVLKRYFKADLSQILEKRSFLQIPLAAFLGALPGCGGAVIVVTQFVNGGLRFGGLVAVLIATMGDAAILLISQKPNVALLIFAISMTVAIVAGVLVDWFHEPDFLKPKPTNQPSTSAGFFRLPAWQVTAFTILVIPGSVIGILEAFQVDVDRLLGLAPGTLPIPWLGFCGALLCITVWLFQPLDSWGPRFANHAQVEHLRESVTAETCFVSVWVILGFLAYELFAHVTGLDVRSYFLASGASGILIAALVGLIPGCGPQILVTTLYINGVIPFSAQLANALSNDGDALFPAIALAPRVAVRATIYSAVPAFIVGYITLWMGY